MVLEILIPFDSLLCTKQRKIFNAFLPIIGLTKPMAIQLCGKLGKNVYIAGNFETREDFDAFYDNVPNIYYDECGGQDNWRSLTWLPYHIENGQFLHDITNKSLTQQYFYPPFEGISKNDNSYHSASVWLGIFPRNTSIARVPSNDALYAYFLSRVKQNLHIVLCFSPVGEKFRRIFKHFMNITKVT